MKRDLLALELSYRKSPTSKLRQPTACNLPFMRFGGGSISNRQPPDPARSRKFLPMASKKLHTTASATQAPLGTQSIQRVVMILRDLASRNREGLRLIDLVDSLQLEQPTVHRMLKSLVAESLVMQDPHSKRYFLGRSMYEFGLAASQRFDFRSLCGPTLSNLARQTGDTVFLTSRSGDESVCLDRLEGTFPVKVFTLALGDRRPLGVGASSMALLSAYPLAEIRHVIFSNASRLAEFGEPNPEDLFSRVQTAKQMGYSVRDLPHFEGIRAIGVPVFDFEAQPVAAISISTLTARLTGDGFDERLSLLREHADQIRKLTAPTSAG